MKPKLQRQKDYLSIVQVLAGEWLLEYERLLPTQIRIKGNNRIFDVYPNSNKFFDLKSRKWGVFGDFLQFISKEFKIKVFA